MPIVRVRYSAAEPGADDFGSGSGEIPQESGLFRHEKRPFRLDACCRGRLVPGDFRDRPRELQILSVARPRNQIYLRGVAPQTPLQSHSLGASPPRSVRLARSRCSLAADRGVAPQTPLQSHSLGASPPRSVRLARSRCSLAADRGVAPQTPLQSHSSRWGARSVPVARVASLARLYSQRSLSIERGFAIKIPTPSLARRRHLDTASATAINRVMTPSTLAAPRSWRHPLPSC